MAITQSGTSISNISIRVRATKARFGKTLGCSIDRKFDLGMQAVTPAYSFQWTRPATDKLKLSIRFTSVVKLESLGFGFL